MFGSRNRCITGREADRIGYKNDIMMQLEKIGNTVASQAVDRIYINNESCSPFLYTENVPTFTAIGEFNIGLINAFDWEDTQDGYDYWDRINNEFIYDEGCE